MHRFLSKSVVRSVLFLLVLSFTLPAAAGGPGAVYAGPLTISVVTEGHGKKVVQTIPAAYGPNEYKLIASRAGTVIQLNCELEGDMSKRPANLQAEYRVIPGKGAKAEKLSNDGTLWRVKGEGYFYADVAFTSGSESFYSSSRAKACIARTQPAVELTLSEWTSNSPLYPGEVDCSIYASEATSGRFAFSQANGNLTATFACPFGTFSQTIASPTVEFLGISVWDGYDHMSRSDPTWNPWNGFETGPIPMAGPDCCATIRCTTKPIL